MTVFPLSFVVTLFRGLFPINAEVFSFSLNRFYTVLALSSGSALGCREQNRPQLYLQAIWTSVACPRQRLSSAWALKALMQSGLGSQILWPHNSPSKSCCPAPRTEKRVLMTSGLCHGLPRLVFLQCRSLVVCLGHAPSCETFFWFTHAVLLSFRYTRCAFNKVSFRGDANPTVEDCFGN